MPELLTAAEAAVILRCHEKTVRRLIGRGELRAELVAGRWLIRPEDLPTRRARRDPVGVAPARVLPRGDGPTVQAARRVTARLDAA